MNDKQIKMNVDINFVNEDVNDLCINTCRVEGIATTNIPRIVKVFGGSAEGVSCNLLCNCNTEVSCDKNCDPVSIFKLARFIFPKQDPGPTAAALKEINELQALEYLINVAGHRLTWDLKQEWDVLCNRDTAYPEITNSGVLATQFDLKQEINTFKRSKAKEQYIAHKNEQNGRANTVLNTTVSVQNIQVMQAEFWHRMCLFSVGQQVAPYWK